MHKMQRFPYSTKRTYECTYFKFVFALPPISYAPQATCIDETDVVVWGRMANAALQLDDLRLARHALESALSVSSGHWPSIDKLCTVCAD